MRTFVALFLFLSLMSASSVAFADESGPPPAIIPPGGEKHSKKKGQGDLYLEMAQKTHTGWRKRDTSPSVIQSCFPTFGYSQINLSH